MPENNTLEMKLVENSEKQPENPEGSQPVPRDIFSDCGSQQYVEPCFTAEKFHRGWYFSFIILGCSSALAVTILILVFESLEVRAYDSDWKNTEVDCHGNFNKTCIQVFGQFIPQNKGKTDICDYYNKHRDKDILSCPKPRNIANMTEFAWNCIHICENDHENILKYYIIVISCVFVLGIFSSIEVCSGYLYRKVCAFFGIQEMRARDCYSFWDLVPVIEDVGTETSSVVAIDEYKAVGAGG